MMKEKELIDLGKLHGLHEKGWYGYVEYYDDMLGDFDRYKQVLITNCFIKMSMFCAENDMCNFDDIQLVIKECHDGLGNHLNRYSVGLKWHVRQDA